MNNKTMLKTSLLTFLALLAFAGNSVLNRLALSDNVIDAASFTVIRLASGIVLLMVLVSIRNKTSHKLSAKNNPIKTITTKSGSWLSACYLYIYAMAFSYAYISLATGVGALILFGCVQITMIIYAMLNKKRLHIIEWVGFVVALFGLYTLLAPDASVPIVDNVAPTPLFGFMLMAISGVAWGLYTLAGKGSKDPLADTASNFLRTLPLIALTLLFTFKDSQLSTQGILLAITSGAITSGLGYAIWYSVLPKLSVTQAAILQLTVPIIAALGGVIFSNEIITSTLVVSSALVLGGVLVVTVGKRFIGKVAN